MISKENILTSGQLNNICKEISDCKACSFHKDLERLELPFRPDAPFDGLMSPREHFKVMTIGINPGWNESAYPAWREIYAEQDYEQYKARVIESYTKTRQENRGRQPYRDSVYYTFMEINSVLNIYPPAEIKRLGIFDTLFWANLSFCSSSSTSGRTINGQQVPLNLAGEEIPKCLEKGYLKKLMQILVPELVIFFGYDALNFFHFRKIFDINSFDDVEMYQKTRYPSQKRKGKSIETTIIACKIAVGNGKRLSVLFLPHPSYRFSSEEKHAALKEVSNWLAGY